MKEGVWSTRSTVCVGASNTCQALWVTGSTSATDNSNSLVSITYRIYLKYDFTLWWCKGNVYLAETLLRIFNFDFFLD